MLVLWKGIIFSKSPAVWNPLSDMSLPTLLFLTLVNTSSFLKIQFKVHFLYEVFVKWCSFPPLLPHSHYSLPFIPSANASIAIIQLSSEFSLRENINYLIVGACIICIWVPFLHVLLGTLLIINPYLLAEYMGYKKFIIFSLYIYLIYIYTHTKIHAHIHMYISSILSYSLIKL